MEKLFLSIIIPTFQEEKYIGKTISTIESFLINKSFNYEIIVSDDGSHDNTVKLAQEIATQKENLKVLQAAHQGKGAAVKKGVLVAQGKYILFTDADLSTPIHEFNKLFNYTSKYDIIIGSRALSDSEIKVHQPWWREKLGRIFNIIVQSIILKDIKDTQCGFKLFKSNVAHDLFNRIKLTGFSFDVEILYLAQKSGYAIKEVPIIWKNRAETKVSIAKELFKVITDLIKIKIIHSEKHKKNSI